MPACYWPITADQPAVRGPSAIKLTCMGPLCDRARPQHQPHFTQGARPSTGCALTTLSAQGVMPVGKRLARAGLVWMAFFKSA